MFSVGQTWRVSFDPYAPYGPLVDTTMRVVAWNVWGRYGAWEERQAGIEDLVATAEPDIVCLVESWATPEASQADRVGDRLGVEHRMFVGDWDQDGWTSGFGVVSRWPITQCKRQVLGGDHDDGNGEALLAVIDGPRGPVQLFVVMLDYPLYASGVRQAQVRQLAAFVARTTHGRHPIVVCGDFNAGPDSDELRMLTGRSETPVPGLVFYDAWEVAGDGTPGYTWSNRNPLAAPGLYIPIGGSTTSFPRGPGPAESAIPRIAPCLATHRPPSNLTSRITTASSPTCATDRLQQV
jgi:endonuclease/exonuclease/phosphatase family metal-dependent hydrolase